MLHRPVTSTLALLPLLALHCRQRGCVVVPLLASLLTAGCASYQPLPQDPIRTEREYAARSPSDAAVATAMATLRPAHAASWPPAAWDRGDLLVAALALNPRVLEGRANWAVADAALASANARPGPVLTLLTEYAGAAGGSSPWLLGLVAGLVLDPATQRDARTALARLAMQQAGLDLAETLWSVRSSVHRALVDALLAGEEVALLDEVVRARAETARLIRNRLESGAVARDEFDRASAEQFADAQRKEDARRRLALARVALGEAIGLPAAAIDGATLQWPDIDSPPVPTDAALESWTQAALLSRADLRRAASEYASSEQSLRLEIARQFPQVSLGPGYVWERGVTKLPFDLALALPPGYRNQGAIGEAEARRELSARHLESVQAAIRAQIELARADLSHGEEALRIARSGELALSRDVESAIGLAFELGAADRLQCLDARLSRLNAQLRVLEALCGVHRARAALEDALRRPLDGPEIDVVRNATAMVAAP